MEVPSESFCRSVRKNERTHEDSMQLDPAPSHIMSLTAGAGTRCMSLLSSSPSLQTVRSVLGDEAA